MSCNKDRDDPQIRFITPAQNSEVEAGVQFTMQAEVTDNEAISSIVVGGDVQDLEITGITDVLKHNFLVNITPSADTPSGAELTITVTAKDVAGNSESEDLVVIVK
ncbi:hypothetical protein GCM10007940_15340 [Portibacter lacus]|uniref:Uncharacterized protein n=2 Tax=Portibacter lacus TaxID=1099794 RepID=A0AA37WEQ3_9BACT|nr:hypothetical protein GCM10007940_15340 [Portibacter lacus]